MKLNIPSMTKSKNVNPTGEHGPDKVVVEQLPGMDHNRKTIHDIINNTRASEFAEAGSE